MGIGYWLQGVGLGVAIAAPVGPIGLLCIRRTLMQGQLMGLVSGLGAATADGVYGCIAGFGLTAAAQFLVAGADWLRIVGGLFLCYLGVKTLMAQPADQSAPISRRGLWGAYGSTCLLTLTNPATIFSFIAIFAGLGIADPGRSPVSSALVVLGVFTGSALWWLVLSWGVNRFRERLTPRRLIWLNRVAGAAILGFGLVALGAKHLGVGH